MSHGKELKKEGMDLVLSNESDDWKVKYKSHVNEFLCSHTRFTNEDVRMFMSAKGLGPPHHGGTWGAIFSQSFAKSMYVISTGRTVSAKLEDSHARPLAEWRSLLGVADDELLTMNQELMALASKVKTHELDVLAALKKAMELGARVVQ